MKPSLPFAGVTGALALFTFPLVPAFAGTYTNDFESGDTTGLTIFPITGDPPEVVPTGGNPGGYLKLTDAVNSTTSTVIFPDFEAGIAVKAFVFDVDCRIGNGSDVPADGFSISFARPGDDVLDDGAGFIGGAAEEGTATGLAIGFDCYDNGNGDVVGITIRLDGTLIDEVEAPTLNGAVDDPTSLQTGPIGEAGWAHLTVELKEGGNLDVTWKGEKIVDNLPTGYVPSPGRIVFGARTGGLNQVHHFDNLSLVTTPTDLAFLQDAGFTRIDDGGTTKFAYVAKISDFETSSVVTPPGGITGFTVDGTNVPVSELTTSKEGAITTVVWIPGTAPEPGSQHIVGVTFTDGTNTQTATRTVTAPLLPPTPLLAATPTDTAWNVREVFAGSELSSLTAALEALATAAPSQITEGTSLAINFNDPQAGSIGGVFGNNQPFLSDTDGDDDDFVQVANFQLTVTEPGDYTFWVQSDDGFALRLNGATFTQKSGPGIIDPGDPSTLAHPGTTGNADTRGVTTLAAGTYVLESLFFERGGGASMEIVWSKGNIIDNPEQAAWQLVVGSSAVAVLPATLPETPAPGAPGHWGVREIRDHGADRSLAGAIETASGDLSGFTVTDQSQPVINHNDLDGGVGFNLGIFNNDLPFIGNLEDTDDDDVIVLARTTVTLDPGTYSIGAIVDDGFAISVRGPGGSFVAAGGPGSIDPASPETIYNPGFNEQPTIGVFNVITGGEYEVFFIAQEGGGGAGWEIFWAPGSFTTLGGTNAWQLLGAPDDPSVPALAPFLPAELPGVPSVDGEWGLRIIRNGGSGSIYNALAAALSTEADFTDGTEPYLNFGNDGNAGLFNSGAAEPFNIDDIPDYPGGSGPEDEVVAVAKARIVIPTAGEWTFGIHSDDGFAFRIPDAEFVRVSGAAHIDPAARNTVIFRYGTGDSNARMVTTLTAGEHDIDFLWFEGGGGSHFEVYAAPGAFNADADTQEWRLIGGPEGLQIVASTGEPQPPSDDFRITDVTFNAGNSEVGITFPSESGVTYTVQWTSDPAGTWQDAGTVPGADGSTTTTLNAATLNGGTAPERFFVRVRRP